MSSKMVFRFFGRIAFILKKKSQVNGEDHWLVGWLDAYTVF